LSFSLPKLEFGKEKILEEEIKDPETSSG